MFLENIVLDAVDPQRLGRFWEAALGCEQLTDAPGIYETRLSVEGGLFLDLCFPHVSDPSTESPRLHLVLGERVPGAGPADPEGNPFRVVEEGAAPADSGPLAAVQLDSADVERDAEFWSWLTGWTGGVGVAAGSLRHPSGLGPVLELCPEQASKGSTKNRMHLDVRLEPGEDPDAAAASIEKRGGATLATDWGDLPWRSYTDPSGNEFCVLPAPS